MIMKLTLILPAIGKIKGEKYMRAWQMEPLSIAQLAALTPADVQITFFDDRMEEIDYDYPTDLVAISVETYTARRAYQIANRYKKKGIPVVMGGFHASLCPEEILDYADSVVIGEAEGVWKTVIDDFKKGALKQKYRKSISFGDYDIIPDRSIYEGKDYLKITLLEAGRGCRFRCDFCSIHNVFNQRYTHRNIDSIVEEAKILKDKNKLLFFVDDNICSDKTYSKELFKELIPLNIKWVGQADITIVQDEELMELMKKSGCQGVLIGMESLDKDVLKKMNKSFNAGRIDPAQAVKKIQSFGLRLYLTFLFGYGNDSPEYAKKVLDFCIDNKIFMVGYNHLTPFPGTELYKSLEKNNRLIFDKWWLSQDYRYGMIPFKTKEDKTMIENQSKRLRRKFYSLSSIFYRMTNLTNIRGKMMLGMYFLINFMLKNDRGQRMRFPLGNPEEKQPVPNVKIDS